MKTLTPVAIVALFALGFANMATAETIVLNSIIDNAIVGLNDSGGAAPAAPGDGWYTSAYVGTVRQRQDGDNIERRTQWYFKFDSSALAGINPDSISSATISIPQIGRINGITQTGSTLRLFDNNFVWDDEGSNFPGWNDGREPSTGTGTLLENWGSGAYQLFGATADTSNTDIEGTFDSSSAALLSTVQSWSISPSNNEGFLLTLVAGSSSALAFGTPTLTITTVPEPGTYMLTFIGMFVCCLYRYRKNRLH